MQSLTQDVASRQCRALAAYLVLAEREKSWARRLVMLSAADEAAPFALATLAAGGAVLWTDPSEASLRESSAAGVIDFQVTMLSEALRILKNEVRKGLPVSVGVLDAGRRVWPEAVERGVQPDALLAGAEDAASASVLLARGANRLDLRATPELREHRTENWRERRAGDAALLASLNALHGFQRASAVRWFEAAPRLFPRDLYRCYAAEWAASKEDR